MSEINKKDNAVVAAGGSAAAAAEGNPEATQPKSVSQAHQADDEGKEVKTASTESKEIQEDEDEIIELNENVAVVPDFDDPTLEVIEVDKDEPPPEDLDDDDDDPEALAALDENQYGDDDYDGGIELNLDEDAGAAAGGDETKSSEAKSHAIFEFSKHTDAVYAVALHPTDEKIAASGGGDDSAYIFSLEDGKVLHSYTGLSDSVVDLAFNFDGTLLAIGVFDGEIFVYDTTTGEEKQHFSIGSDLACLTWHPKGNVLMAGADDRNIWLWNCNTGATLAVLSGHSDGVLQTTFSSDGTLILSSGADGKTIIWNPKARKPMFTFVNGAPLAAAPAGKKQVSPVLTLVAHPSKPLLASGAEDGSVHIYSLSSGKALFNLKTAHTQSVETLAFSPEVGVNSLLASGSVDGFVKIWDLNKNCQQRHQLLHPNAVTKVAWHPSKLILYTTCSDSVVRTWDALSGRLLGVRNGHKDGILALKVASHGTKLLTGSEDHNVLLFDVEDLISKAQ